MLALLGLLPTLVPAVAPVLGRLFAGADGEKVARDVASAVTAVAGSTDEVAVRQAMADPEKAGALHSR
jgi:hypothetical protein